MRYRYIISIFLLLCVAYSVNQVYAKDYSFASLSDDDTLSRKKIVKVDMDSVLCSADSMRISIGTSSVCNIQYEKINHWQHFYNNGRYFFPGCPDSANGDVTIPIDVYGYDSSARITSAEQLVYLRLNMEHSKLSDIGIFLTCPNGNTQQIFGRDVNDDYRLSLGKSISDSVGENTCDSLARSNRAGEGWDYCWSWTSQRGLKYSHAGKNMYTATTDTIIDNGDTIFVVDSTHLALLENFYIPQTDFNINNGFYGCPFNGTWKITLKDTINRNSGWTFGHELVFDTTIPHTPHIVKAIVEEDTLFPTLNDSTIVLNSPVAGINHDTIITNHIQIVFDDYDTLDTMFIVRYVPHYDTTIFVYGCHGGIAEYGDEVFDSDTIIKNAYSSIYGCDSLITVQILFKPIYEVYDTVILPYDDTTTTPYHLDTVLTSYYGCDSTVHYFFAKCFGGKKPHLLISENNYNWNSDTTFVGCRPYRLMFKDTADSTASHLLIFGDGDSLVVDSASHLYDTVGVFYPRMIMRDSIGCVDTLGRGSKIVVHGAPAADFSWHIEEPAMSNPEAQFTNLTIPINDSTTYMWEIQKNSGENYDTTTSFSPFYHWGEKKDDMTGEYLVRLIAYANYYRSDSTLLQCPDTMEHKVTIVNDYLEFPNLVTPNDDGVNDVWKIINLAELQIYTMNELWIYSTWGVLVYHVKNINSNNQYWDPNATHSPDGTYYFRFMAKSQYGIVKHYGSIEVVRGE